MKRHTVYIPLYNLVGGEAMVTRQFIKNVKKEFNIINTPFDWSLPLKPFSIWKRLHIEIQQSSEFSKHIHPDNSVVYSTRLLPLLACSIRVKNVPRIFHFHGLSHQPFKIALQKNPLLFFYLSVYYLIIYALEFLGIHTSKKIIVPTQESANYLSRHFLISQKNMCIIPNGIDHAIFLPPKINSMRSQILWVGRISPEKNIELFLELAKKFPKLQFKTITELNLSPQQMAAEYQKSVATIITSTNEQMPLNYLESIACGTPVITSPLPSLMLFQNKIDSRLISPDYNVHSFENCVNNYINSRDKSKVLKRCIKLAQNFSDKNAANAIKEVIIQHIP